MNTLSQFPPKNDLLAWHKAQNSDRVLKTNAHIHTPYSFSAFSDLEQIFELAQKEQVKVLGINDFYTTSGYAGFYELALKNKVFPLFNVEFMGLSPQEQAQGIRINDPKNPGRIYFCGKGLDFPVALPAQRQEKLNKLIAESQKQTAQMTEKLNDWLAEINAGFSLDFQEIKNRYAKELVRERHIAKALRIAIEEQFETSEKQQGFLKKLYSGKQPTATTADFVALEGELRSQLLKAGGKAFVKENPDAFLLLPEIVQTILAAGGIPCYPVLLDDAKGNFTDFEADQERLLEKLSAKKVFCVELIPGRNSLEELEKFVSFFHQNGFVVTFGTEHNTPYLAPLSLSARNSTPLSENLEQIAYQGAALIAAHQYLRAQGDEGYVDATGTPARQRREEFVALGKAVIEYFMR